MTGVSLCVCRYVLIWMYVCLLRLVLRVETLLVIFICLKSCTSHTICRYVVVLRASHSVCVRFPPPSPFVDVAPKVS